MRNKITKEFIDAAFECEHQSDALVTLYKFAFPDWDVIESVDGFPAVGEKASNYIWDKFIEFDKKHHPKVMAGGLWLNNGFSSQEGKRLGLGPWEISTDEVPVVYRDEVTQLVRQRGSCLTCGD